MEAYVLDLDADLYGQQVALDFVERLRGQITFESPEQLVREIDEDVVRTRRILGG